MAPLKKRSSNLFYLIFFVLSFCAALLIFSRYGAEKDEVEKTEEVSPMTGEELIQNIKLDCSKTLGHLKSIELKEDKDTLYVRSTSCNNVKRSTLYQFLLLLDKKTYQFDVSLETEPTGVELVDGKPKSIAYLNVLEGTVEGKSITLDIPKSLVGDYTEISLRVFVREKDSGKVLYEFSQEIT